MTVVFLDACVLVPITLTNVLLTAAEDSLLQPHWSPEVLEEAIIAINEIRPHLNETQIHRRFSAMDAAFPGASVAGDPSRLDHREFPDPDDRHVVAAAMAAGVEIIVTANIRDFPTTLMNTLGLIVMSPDELLLKLLAENKTAVLEVMLKVASTLRSPQQSIEELLVALKRAGAPSFAEKARRLLKHSDH
ncbi:MAG: PIN domain-containing protein [Propionibacteriaceae bacterium]|jgi:hypothetical protein|nr:PIN domain-containing protein [Propionibacterium sp.]MDO4646869.1 PIN domain-containing protein [Propionibacteriaceae bacterium]